MLRPMRVERQLIYCSYLEERYMIGLLLQVDVRSLYGTRFIEARTMIPCRPGIR